MATPWRDRHRVVLAVYIIFRKDGKLLLLQRANTGYFDGSYSLPSGHVDGGESAAQAAAREAKEEVGVDIAPKDLRLAHTLHRVAEEGDHERIDLFFEATIWQREPVNAEPHKCSGLRWASPANLPSNMVPVVHHALERLMAGERYSQLGFSA